MSNSFIFLFSLLICFTPCAHALSQCHVSWKNASYGVCGDEKFPCATIQLCLSQPEYQQSPILLDGPYQYSGKGFCNLTNSGASSTLPIFDISSSSGANISCPGQPFLSWYLASNASYVSLQRISVSDCLSPLSGGCVSIDGDPHGAFTLGNVGFFGVSFSNGQSMLDGGCVAVLHPQMNPTFDDTSFTGCKAGRNGGAVYTESAPANLGGSRFSQNSAVENGGALCVLSPLVVGHTGSSGFSVVFEENAAGNAGGALWMSVASTFQMSLDAAVFAYNSAKTGGAFALYNLADDWSAVWQFSVAYFIGNTATEDGGAVHAEMASSRTAVSFISSNFSGNAAKRDGGALSGGPFNMVQSVFEKNSALRDGGAANGAIVSSTQSHFTQNSAARDGGAIWGHHKLIQTAIESNSAGRDGGGYFGTGQLTECNVYNNTAGRNGGGVACTGDSIVLSGTSMAFNAAKDNGGGVWLSQCDARYSNDISCYGNSAAYGGGAAASNSTFPEMQMNFLLQNNFAQVSGGGFYMSDSDLAVNLPWLINNTAAGYGGGVYFDNTWGVPLESTVSTNLPNQVNCSSTAPICSLSTIVNNCSSCSALCAEDPDAIITCYV